MYTSNFVANSEYLTNYLLNRHVFADQVSSNQIIYELVDHVIDKENVINEFPRINSYIQNVGKFPLETILSMINNVSLAKRPISTSRRESFHMNTKYEYINSKATNFMIIAKPGIETVELAKKMEQKFKCVHINCDRLVEREIQSKSRLGKWLDTNLQFNKILPIEIMLWLIQRETRTNKVLYCGYILTGLPLIPNMELNANKNFLTEEEFYIFLQIIDDLIEIPHTRRARELAKLKKQLFSEYQNLDDDDDELIKDSADEIKPPNDIQPIPKLFHRLTCDRDVRFSIHRQLFFALELQNQPTILIYVDCDDEDIITKNLIFNNSTPNELEGIRTALRRYNNALDIIQQFICFIPLPNFIYCHGIYTTEDTFKCCSDKINNSCGFKRVFMPIDFYDTFKNDESIVQQLEATTNYGILDILCKINPVRDDLGWFRSEFENKCPIMMNKGKCVFGKYQHSVQFTGLVYLLSSNENKSIFIENPQLFIRPLPTCRVAIMGPRCSGKSTFARCLAKFFDNSTIIDVKYLFEYYKKMEVNSRYYAEACERAISLLRSTVLINYNNKENIRHNKINNWIGVMKQNIIDYLEPIPIKPGKKKPSKKLVHAKEALRQLLEDNGFETAFPEILSNYLDFDDLFMDRLPLEIRHESLFREPQTSDSDVQKLVTEYMNELSKDYVLPFARKLEILVTKIRLCEKRQKILTQQNKLYGYWILDGLPPDLELVNGLQEMDCLPDIIVHMDDSVGERLAEIQNIKCHREFYDINYVVGTIAARNKIFFKHMINKNAEGNSESPKYFSAQLVRRELDHILQQESLQGISDFHEENEKYREDFEHIKSFLDPFGTHFVAVDIHGTSWTDAIIIGLTDYMNYFRGHPHSLYDTELDTSKKILKKHFRVGTTAEYCPVLFVDKLLLKLGVAKYAVLLNNRTYLMSSEEANQTFVKNPYRYCELERPFRIPPYRLCVIGNYHISKRGDLRRVADILGAKYLSITDTINLYYGKLQQNRKLDISTYYEILDDLGDKLVNEIVAPLFQDGFLFEGFPVTAEHLNQMIALHHYPEQIFYLKIENEHLMNDELAYYMKQYKDILVNKIDALQLQNKDWVTQRKLRFNELFDELPENAIIIEEEEELSTDRLELETLSEILKAFDVVPNSNRKMQIKQLNAADMVNEEMPPDMYTKLIDSLMKFPLKQEVKKFIHDQMEEFEKIKMVAEDHLIPFIQIRLHPYTTKEIEKSLLKHIKESADRQYIFERAHPISYTNALDYLEHGQFLFSRHFWTCPVRNYDMNYPIKLLIRTPDLETRVQSFVHNAHIYFVQRLHHNVEAFFARPYIYTSQMNSCQTTNSIRLVVMGPRNTGCLSLCQRIAKEFQLTIFTLDEMKQYVVNKFKWTKLAKDLIENNMEISNDQQICDLIKISINFEVQGWILRDLPLNVDLIKCFILNSLIISLVVFLDPTGIDLWTNFKNKYSYQHYKQKVEVIEKLYGMLTNLTDFSNMRSAYFKGLNQNVITIKDFTSTWSTWNKAYREILLLLRLFNFYELSGMDLAAGLYKLDVTDYELEYRLSSMKLYCPICWLDKKLFVKYRYHYIDDEDAEPIYSNNLYEKNLFQFRKNFYWSCNNHNVELMVNPESYLPTNQTLPDEIPKLVKDWKNFSVTNQGYCPVAYLKSRNKDVIIGLSEYSVLYFSKIYVMSCEYYCLKFLKNPDKYKNVEIIFIYSNVANEGNEDFKNMKLDFGTITPTLITNALLECAFERPKHYGLDPSQSLEIYLGLYLKSHNSNSSDVNINIHKSLFLKYWNDCKLVQRQISEMQITGNPYLIRTKNVKLEAQFFD